MEFLRAVLWSMVAAFVLTGFGVVAKLMLGHKSSAPIPARKGIVTADPELKALQGEWFVESALNPAGELEIRRFWSTKITIDKSKVRIANILLDTLAESTRSNLLRLSSCEGVLTLSTSGPIKQIHLQLSSSQLTEAGSKPVQQQYHGIYEFVDNQTLRLHWTEANQGERPQSFSESDSMPCYRVVLKRSAQPGHEPAYPPKAEFVVRGPSDQPCRDVEIGPLLGSQLANADPWKAIPAHSGAKNSFMFDLTGLHQPLLFIRDGQQQIGQLLPITPAQLQNRKDQSFAVDLVPLVRVAGPIVSPEVKKQLGTLQLQSLQVSKGHHPFLVQTDFGSEEHADLRLPPGQYQLTLRGHYHVPLMQHLEVPSGVVRIALPKQQPSLNSLGRLIGQLAPALETLQAGSPAIPLNELRGQPILLVFMNRQRNADRAWKLYLELNRLNLKHRDRGLQVVLIAVGPPTVASMTQDSFVEEIQQDLQLRNGLGSGRFVPAFRVGFRQAWITAEDGTSSDPLLQAYGVMGHETPAVLINVDGVVVGGADALHQPEQLDRLLSRMKNNLNGQ